MNIAAIVPGVIEWDGMLVQSLENWYLLMQFWW